MDDLDVVVVLWCFFLLGVGVFCFLCECLCGVFEEVIWYIFVEGGVLMGICVGYQFFFELSEEFGEMDGFGFFQGYICELLMMVFVLYIGWN